MDSSSRKGYITIDDFATGITYNNEPYQSNDRFAILTPDSKSQQSFYKVGNYTHRYLGKDKRSPFVFYKEKIIPMEGFDMALLNHENPKQAVNQENIKPRQPIKQEDVVTEKQSTVKSLPISKSNKQILQNQIKYEPIKKSKPPKKYGIYHPKELYLSSDIHLENTYTSPFGDSRYNNMIATLNLKKTSTLGEVLKKSEEAKRNVLCSLKLQKNKLYLKSQLLPPVPKSRGAPAIVTAQILKNPTKRSTNPAHNKLTNGGFTRTTYGGLFMH